MRIRASFNIPIGVDFDVEESELQAAEAAGIEVDEDEPSLELAEWLIKYYCSADSKYVIHDIIAEGEVERDLPELIQVDSIE